MQSEEDNLGSKSYENLNNNILVGICVGLASTRETVYIWAHETFMMKFMTNSWIIYVLSPLRYESGGAERRRRQYFFWNTNYHELSTRSALPLS